MTCTFDFIYICMYIHEHYHVYCLGQSRKVVVTTYVEQDPLDVNYLKLTKHYVIYEIDRNNKKILYRHFLMEKKYGRIIELFDQFKINENMHEKSERKGKINEILKSKNDKINKLLHNSNKHTHLNGIFGVLPLIDNDIHSKENEENNENEKNDEDENENSRLLPSKTIRKNGIFSGLEKA
jgi:hypothetical protein